MKTREGTDHPDRDTQFHHINYQVAAFAEAGQPVISVDNKMKVAANPLYSLAAIINLIGFTRTCTGLPVY